MLKSGVRSHVPGNLLRQCLRLLRKVRVYLLSLEALALMVFAVARWLCHYHKVASGRFLAVYFIFLLSNM